ncbi:lactosylceramide 1,3-N-acetyl-beta-D-glucosaminyltransferase isoform X2 [Diceros bicornis minor]|uniref:lactosylceramide 1,3-N-acetyl-beta-D-glucosaminyltransferase isoform X2 n=1 Tax=Diceros bicornis minor TaxID=77932 RepID=UPI0026EDD35A|nr:lactosylceramide 1,3-N-acetyl-beta-D-glucosaminyltransferase isoform X2 [Diceros bicornis minor]
MVCSLCRGSETGSLRLQRGRRAAEPPPRPAPPLPAGQPRRRAPPRRSSSRAPGKEGRSRFCFLRTRRGPDSRLYRTFPYTGWRSTPETSLKPSQHPFYTVAYYTVTLNLHKKK